MRTAHSRVEIFDAIEFRWVSFEISLNRSQKYPVNHRFPAFSLNMVTPLLSLFVSPHCQHDGGDDDDDRDFPISIEEKAAYIPSCQFSCPLSDMYPISDHKPLKQLRSDSHFTFLCPENVSQEDGKSDFSSVTSPRSCERSLRVSLKSESVHQWIV